MSTRKDTILERARALPRSVEPYRDLWDDIEAKLDRPNEATIWRPRLAAAAAVMFAVTSALSFWLGGVVNTPEPMQVAAVDPEVFNRFGPRFAMGPSFSQARTDLSISVADQLEHVSPETKIVVEQNLNDINRALDQINAALSGDPDNNMLQQLLMSTYTEELVVLGEIDALTRYVREGVEI